MGWDNVATLQSDSNINGKEQSTSKEYVEDTVNIADVYDGHIDGRTWYDVVMIGTIRGGNVRP